VRFQPTYLHIRHTLNRNSGSGRLDVMLAKRKMSVGDFSEAIGITPAKVAALKNGRANAVRFTTLDAICRVLECQPGVVLRYEP
jgi:putative transcriptional regulator